MNTASRGPAEWVKFLVLCGLCLLWIVPMVAEAKGPAEANVENAPAVVMRVVELMPRGGGYVWESTGVPQAIRHAGETVLKKTTADGTYCSGVTFTVVMEAAKRAGLLEDKTVAAVKQFQRHWYGTDEASAETQCVFAMQQLGIGDEIAHDEAQAGDFVQFWRQRSGHSVVFIEWLEDRDGGRIGLRYWSSQKATDGMGVNTEYFAGIEEEGQVGTVDPQRLYVGRLGAE